MIFLLILMILDVVIGDELPTIFINVLAALDFGGGSYFQGASFGSRFVFLKPPWRFLFSDIGSKFGRTVYSF